MIGKWILSRSPIYLEKAHFAYLSACHAEMTRACSLMDEAIHLAFPHVIGSFWQIDDFTSSTVAKDVYKVTCRDGRFDATLAAEGLHFAVRRLRGEPLVGRTTGNSRLDPLRWSAYIHIGA